jgi:hypothetical protein
MVQEVSETTTRAEFSRAGQLLGRKFYTRSTECSCEKAVYVKYVHTMFRAKLRCISWKNVSAFITRGSSRTLESRSTIQRCSAFAKLFASSNEHQVLALHRLGHTGAAMTLIQMVVVELEFPLCFR